jgi:hypothetical protein
VKAPFLAVALGQFEPWVGGVLLSPGEDQRAFGEGDNGAALHAFIVSDEPIHFFHFLPASSVSPY